MSGRGVLLFLPAITVAVVGFAVLGAVRERPVVAARLYGGPTDAGARLAWRVQVLSVLGQTVVPHPAKGVHVRVQGRTQSGAEAQVSATVDTDPEGSASVQLDRPDGSEPLRVQVRLTPDGPLLTWGAVRVTRDLWARGASRRGGWMRGRFTGTLRVRAAPGRGVFAVPFQDPLWVEVSKAGSPVVGAVVRVRAEGAVVKPESGPTDSRGRWVTVLRPNEHAVTLFVDASGGGESGRYEGTLPIVPGALQATVRDGAVLVQSPIPRQRAYVSIVSLEGRLDGRALDLVPDANGGAQARFQTDAILTGPTWGVVSSESDMHSMALVGWPLGSAGTDLDVGDPPKTFDARDLLLLDGLVHVRERERQRQRWLLGFAAAFTLFSAFVILLVVWKRIEESRVALDTHLARQLGTAATAEPARPLRLGVGPVVVALACIAFGFVVIAALALMRLE